MKNYMKSKLFAVVLISFLSMGSAKATTHIGPIFSYNGVDWDAIFGNNAITGIFTDVYTFTLPAGSGGGGGASVISGFDWSGPNVVFSSFSFDDVTTSTNIASGTFSPFFADALVFLGPLNTADTYSLTVTGSLMPFHHSGSYSGNFHISPIPEPETYAMLLTGLGLIGVSLRRRRAK